MTNHKTLACLALAVLFAGSAQAQTYTKQAELELDATGDAFQVGSQRFHIAPSAVPTPVSETTDPSRDVVVAGFEIKLPAAAAGSRSKRDLGAGPASATSIAQGGTLAAAVADGGSGAVLVTRRLNVYADDIRGVADLAASTGGEVTYSSALGGKAIIKYPSVEAALAAMKRIQGRPGIKEVSPQIIQHEWMTR